ncbi:DUF572-domain-containing protein [Terfezia boudieri ATCC MYA-4762]|uniref:DUF572-domain-containing protein n=1 Tax=Terfezia boudieri ATCC MYA-4762 TaxID=1051890 RepID=A0A3N4M332_9PEZI|nr:DUF572-domain-containing protein [Terfezia boudieri ATCC MYA-4762]
MQGFNMGRYVPPEHEGVLSGNQLHKKKPPGQHGSTLTVRFEMPFNIVCNHCQGHIAQGVRFNAEKTKVGNYYSTPIWAFKIKHTTCSGVIVIQTDPKNTAYVVTEGGKKQHEGTDEPGAVIKTKSEEEEGVMGKLEKQAENERIKKESGTRIEELWRLQEKQWADPYEHSKKMRKIFRTERNRLQTQAANAAALQDKLSLGIDLLPETEEDAAAAKMIDFGEASAGEDAMEEKVREVLEGRALFDAARERSRDKEKERRERREERERRKTMTKSQIHAEDVRQSLESKLRRNTKARMDPFWSGLAARGGAAGSTGSGGLGVGNGGSSRSVSRDRDGMTPPTVLAGLKRKKPIGEKGRDVGVEVTLSSTTSDTRTIAEPKTMTTTLTLVDYGLSDSD